jgi:hypothetical protein
MPGRYSGLVKATGFHSLPDSAARYGQGITALALYLYHGSKS